jgi:hypothetical protein
MERTDNMKRKQILSSICAAAMAVSCMTVSVDAGYSDIVWEEYGETIRAPYIAYHIHRSGTVWTPPEEDAGDTSWEDGFKHILYKHYEGDCWHDGYDIYRCETTDGAPGSETYGEPNGVSYFWEWNGLGGHQYVDTVVAPTYEHKGYTHHECTVCGWNYDDAVVDMLVNDDEETYTDDEGHVIERVSINPAVITLEQERYRYQNGQEIEPVIKSVVLGEKELNRGLDYIVNYEDNIQPGTGRVIITGVGAYKDTAVAEFTIFDNSIMTISQGTSNGEAITLDGVSFDLDGYDFSADSGDRIPDFPDGTHTLTAKKDGYVTRQYQIAIEDGKPTEPINIELHHLGDINGDGKLNAADLLKAKSHIKGITELEGYDLECANVDGNAGIKASDLLKMKAHVKGASLLWE